MSEFPSEEDERIVREMSEHVAEYRARPLRSITGLLADGQVARLDCGHWKELRMQFQVGDTVRCQDCFDTGMRMARWMVERDCG